jgi:hypothetical protein
VTPSPKAVPATPAPVTVTGMLMSCGCVRWRDNDGTAPADCPCGYAGAEVAAEIPLSVGRTR